MNINMKSLKELLNESILKTAKDKLLDSYGWTVFKSVSAHPKDKSELKKTIDQAIKLRGNNVDLNWIDTSKIEDMSMLFSGTEFNGDISEWDVRRVKYMNMMFMYSKFNGDISEWDVRNVEDMNHMFNKSEFSGDLSKWNVRKVKNMYAMFKKSPLEKHPPRWYED